MLCEGGRSDIPSEGSDPIGSHKTPGGQMQPTPARGPFLSRKAGRQRLLDPAASKIRVQGDSWRYVVMGLTCQKNQAFAPKVRRWPEPCSSDPCHGTRG